MIQIVKENRVFLIGYCLFFLFGIVYQMQYSQLDAIFFFSNNRSVVGNNFFSFWTKIGEYFPWIAIFAYFGGLKAYKKLFQMLSVCALMLIVMSILKMSFAHPRPFSVLENVGMLNKINFVGRIEDVLKGDTSFPSGHTMSAFALWTSMAIFFRKNDIWAFSFLIVAILVGVSRVYLVQHFPEDVLLGSFLGVFIAFFVDYFFERKQLE